MAPQASGRLHCSLFPQHLGMTLIVVIDIIVVAALVGIALTKGFERTLPVAACFLLLFPIESQIQLPGLFSLTTQRVVVITLLGLYIALGKTRDEGGRKRALPLKYLVMVQIVWMLVSTANSFVFTVSLKTVLSQILDYFVVFYVFSRAIGGVETVRKILYSLVVGMVICSVFGAIESYSRWSVISLFPPYVHRLSTGVYAAVSYRGNRVQSTFGHPILFGGALAMAIPQALYLLTLAKTRGRKVFLWSAIMLMFVSIYKTGSRGPWIAVFLSLAVLLLLNKDRLRKYVLVIILMTLTVLIVRPGVWQTIWDLYGETMDPDTLQGVSYQWRYALYRIAVKELDKDFGRALWGYGPESFFYLGIEDEFQGHMVTYDSCDSSIAALMIETGYVGLLITALLLLKPAFVAYRSFRKLAKPANSLCLVLLVNMLAFYFLMTNVAIYGWGQQSYMLWILIALAMTYPHLQRDEGAADDSAQTVPQLVEAMAF